MPPLLSNIFGSDQTSQHTDAQAHQGLEWSPEITIGTEGEYEDAEGANHDYSNETTVGAEISTQIIVDAASGTDETSF